MTLPYIVAPASGLSTSDCGFSELILDTQETAITDDTSNRTDFISMGCLNMFY